MRGGRMAREETTENRLHLAFAIALTLGVAALFYVPALRATHGDWPAPLDDVLIHFDFARATAEGHPFEWIAGQGYSSGETSPLYPFVLAVGYAIGFRGLWLGAWAAIVACASLVAMMRALRELLASSPRAPWWVAWMAGAMLVCVGALDWSWFSGMEIALFGAVLLRALVAAKRARDAPPATRGRAQWRAGAWGAALVLVRPEAAVLVFTIGVAVARRAGARSGIMALARAAAPAAAATLAVLGVNRWMTGDAPSAGALLKLLSANPYLRDLDRARDFALNLVYVKWKLLETFLSARPALWPLLPLLGVAGVVLRRTRALSAACLTGALGWTLLVSWNGAARFQNFRYYMPALALVLVASALGLGSLARNRAGAALGALIAATGILLALPRMPAQIAFFRDASANVHDQQIEVGRRLARLMPAEDSVLVGDAGAIAYVSRRHAIDALGLGGYHRLPFARAAAQGEAATVELIERLPDGERPAWLALYPNWFGAITTTFGREVDRVSLDRNVICGGVTKGIYVADWSALLGADDSLPNAGLPLSSRCRPGCVADLPSHVVDALDVADVVSEAAHAYVSPAPEGGWTLLDVRMTDDGARVFDSGRIIPAGQSERFTFARRAAAPAVLVVRIDADDFDADVTVEHGGEHGVEGAGAERAPLTPVPRRDSARSMAASGRWSLARATLAGGARAGDTVTLTVRRGTLHDFHVWLADGPNASAAR